MPREPIPTWCFALVVVRRDDQFLIVHESKREQQWYLPAGGVEPGETFEAAAHRETLEEAGIPINLVGILRIEHSVFSKGSRFRVVYLAEPVDDTPPKSVPDEESLEAAWVSLDELGNYSLRGEEVRELFTYVANGGTVHPLTILQAEGSPYITNSGEGES